MWTRFSAPLQQTILSAQNFASKEGVSLVNGDHIFEGLLNMDPTTSNGLRLLVDLGVGPSDLAETADRLSVKPVATAWPPVPATAASVNAMKLAPDAKSVIDATADSAARFNHQTIGTEHLLLAYLAMSDGLGYQALNAHGITLSAARGKLAEWMASGKYQREAPSAAPNAATTSSVLPNRPGIVYQIYSGTRIVYLIVVFAPFIAIQLISAVETTPIALYVSMMSIPIGIYVIPYILSTYALSYLLRQRIQRRLVSMPPSQSMKGLGLPFGLSIITGVLLALSLAPIDYAVLSEGGEFNGHGWMGVFAAALCAVLVLNCLATVVAHWLLTFNIRGKHQNLFGGS